MTRKALVLASAFTWVLTAGTASSQESLEEVVPAPVAEAAQPAWDDFEDPDFDPTAPQAAPVSEPVLVSSATPSPSGLGPIAVDGSGAMGRIHTVISGDTLWDISDAYLGTPWVWPSIWSENSGIDNPHVIEPGDRIWITSNEMRRVTAEEAEEMIAAVPDATEVADTYESDYEYDEAAEESMPAAAVEEPLEMATPMEPMDAMTGEIITLPSERNAHYATAATMSTASKLIDSPTLRTYLAEGDPVYLDLGEGEVSVGDEFTIFRDVQKIRDIGTGAVLGYHYDELGWMKVQAVEGESSTAMIYGSSGEIARRDRYLPREMPPKDIPVRAATEDIEGAIVFTPGYRWLLGSTDSAYLNVGSIHGVEVGTMMEVYEAGRVQSSSQMPDTVVAKMVVISIEPESCVAFVTDTVRELEIGDTVRGVRESRVASTQLQ